MRLNPYNRKVIKEIWDNLYSNGDWVNGVHAAPKSPPSNGHRESEMIQPALRSHEPLNNGDKLGNRPL